jgi:hypothetical protein
VRYCFIDGYEYKYTLYEDGTVVRNPTKYRRNTITLTPKKDMRYVTVTLYKSGKHKTTLVHRLIAQHFIANPENKPCINHIDGNCFNNSIKNLEWCTWRENLMHSIDVLKRVRNTDKQRQSAVLQGKSTRKLSLEQASDIRQLIKAGRVRKDIAQYYGVSRSVIDCIAQNKRYLD